jgi:hypothetical protein
MRHIWWANRIVTGAIAIVVTMVAHSDGQGLDTRIPRLANGKPNLNAPPPKTVDGRPDLSGIWRSTQDKYQRNLAADFPRLVLQPSAAASFKERSESAGKANPAVRCLPRGLPGSMLVREYPWKLVQMPASVLILFDEALDFRQIHFDGRRLPDDPQPTWMGYSVGRWEGDTLVSETIGVSEDTWLDDLGHPHSDAMRVLERFRRRTVGMMDVEITIQDAKAYSRSWAAMAHFELLPDTDLDEHICPVQGNP